MTNLNFNFAGRSVIVTGAARGIGLELGRFFNKSGAETFLFDFDEEELMIAAKETGGNPIRVDVANTKSVDQAVDLVVRSTGRIDVLVNNAGILRDSWLWKISDEDWEDVMSVHAGGTFRMTRACVSHFRSQSYGRVINVTSFTGLHGNIGQANYATAKAGIIGFTKTAAKELAAFGVTVNAISPNASTRMVDSIPPDKLAATIELIPLRRFAHPSEICSAVGFLASEEANYVTGVVLPIDGGISM